MHLKRTGISFGHPSQPTKSSGAGGKANSCMIRAVELPL
jgi:hypothetical protein